MNKTTFEKGVEKGTQDVVLLVGAKRFGQTDAERRIRSIHDPDQLTELLSRIIEVQSWSELFGSPAAKSD